MQKKMPLDNLLLQSVSAIDPVCWKHSLSLILMKGLPDLVTNVISLQKEILMTWRYISIMLPVYGNHSRRSQWITGGWKFKIPDNFC
ncbi:hypothetical protein AVEN_243332-1 [Araneus ventricosus]|uniref:Uncharacterized protein n=1 Tax=Araneus ventricosus TaxID=182803 RepID=A0A4Y2NN95_ARAVE|nr:hypothetical protein AVEN_243332-1 [Araneus ventricosus]